MQLFQLFRPVERPCQSFINLSRAFIWLLYAHVKLLLSQRLARSFVTAIAVRHYCGFTSLPFDAASLYPDRVNYSLL